MAAATDTGSVAEGRLAGQVAIVTGGGGGIGSPACAALFREGARVVVVDRDAARVDATMAELGRIRPGDEGRSTLGLALDVREEREVDAMVRRTLDRFGRIDVLVHCAGILRSAGEGPKLLVDLSAREWEDVLATNLRGTFLCNRAVLPAMIAQRRGHIVNLSSTSGRHGRAFDAPYSASKFGVIGLSESLAEENRQFGIRVHVVLPDAVSTPLWSQNGPVPPPEGALPPERVADLILYLVTLPQDTILGNLVIAPFKSRRRKDDPRRSVTPTGARSARTEEGESGG